VSDRPVCLARKEGAHFALRSFNRGLPRLRVFATHLPPMNSQPGNKPDIHSEAFLHSLMRRQLKLSIACAATFLVALLGLPLLNYFFPEAMATRVLGFTLTWFVLGVLFFPFVWVIAWVFIRRSIALEEAEVKEVAGEKVGK
jgi:uncharacterized membrane protein (DUF485 family)